MKLRFAVAFGLLSAIGQLIACARGVRSSMDYIANRRPRFTRDQFWATVVRAIGNIASALLCSSFVHHVDHPVLFAIRVGLVTGLVTAIGVTVNPYIEYYADNLPQRYLGAFGILLNSLWILSPVTAILAGTVRRQADLSGWRQRGVILSENRGEPPGSPRSAAVALRGVADRGSSRS